MSQRGAKTAIQPHCSPDHHRQGERERARERERAQAKTRLMAACVSHPRELRY